MTEITLRDVPINFPFTPYEVQKEYMSKVIECLQKGENGVLESPTGTGKTLSLLCSSLAWLQLKKAQQQANAQGLSTDESQKPFTKLLQTELQKSIPTRDPGESSWSNQIGSTQIIYASRTHSQLAQAMKELKRTNYRHVKAAVLGSRDQMCLHPDLAGEAGQMKVAMCRTKVASRSCHYYNTLDSKKHDSSNFPAEVADIEDLVKFGSKTQCCPYYMAREMMASADIVFMPYNYLLHPQTRKQQRPPLNNNAVILDEGHNVEKMCEESASVQISSTDIALCIAEVTQVMKKFEKEFSELTDDSPKDFTIEDLCVLKAMFLALEDAIDKVELGTVTSGSDSGKKSGTYPASFIFQLLEKAEITKDKMPVLEASLCNIAQFLATTSDSALSKKGGMLLKFVEFLSTVFDSVGEGEGLNQSNAHYKVYIEPEVSKSSRPDSWSSNKTVKNSSAKVINFWCFSPGLAMKSLLKQGVTSIILTSGTLSPLQATISELAIPISVQLENPHIIQSSQVSINVLSKGPAGVDLLSTYVNRRNPNYMAELGRVIKNMSHVVPGGILVFFPSYPVMHETVAHWQETGLWTQINSLKSMFTEPQGRESLGEVMTNFTDALAAEGSRGAVLLAVLRGKVSEGMDFANDQCRAVVVTGLPYPPTNNPRVVLKREYMDNMRKTNPQGLSGRDWYQLEATRAVNQAVGRLIRHASDFGALLLCDQRFASPAITKALSAWLQPHIVVCPVFGKAFGRVSQFFRAMGASRPQQPPTGAGFDIVLGKVRTKAKEEKEVGERNQEGMKKFLENIVRTTQPKTAPSPSPAGLLDALSLPSSQKVQADIKKAVYNKPDEVAESYVQPEPKRRKIKVQPLKFDLTNIDDPSTSASMNHTEPTSNAPNADNASTQGTCNQAEERRKKNAEYLLAVKRRISKDEFLMFKEIVKNYSARGGKEVYDKTISYLSKIFSDTSNKDLFIGFGKYIKPDDYSSFKDICNKMFGPS